MSYTEVAEEASANVWVGPSTSSPRSAQKALLSSSTRTIKRKPPPKITPDLFQSNASTSASFVPVSPATHELIPENADGTEELSQKSLPQTPSRASTQRPQRQILLDIDQATQPVEVPSSSLHDILGIESVSSAKQARKGPLKWIVEREEHASTLKHIPSLSRKTSISAQLKLSLRGKSSRERVPLNISTPTNFVHVSTASQDTKTAAFRELKRYSSQSTPSTPSLRSSMSSVQSMEAGEQYVDEVTPLPNTKAPNSASTDATFTTADTCMAREEVRHPLRPLKSIRRPNRFGNAKHSLDQDSEPAQEPLTNLNDKRKAIYAGKISTFSAVPTILEPSEKVGTLPPAATFAASLNSTLDHAARMHRDQRQRAFSNGSSTTNPSEPELSRSPGSTYTTSSSTRSSLAADLSEFRSFLDFPDIARATSKTSSDNGDSIWDSLDRSRKEALHVHSTGLTYAVAGN